MLIGAETKAMRLLVVLLRSIGFLVIWHF